MHQPRCLALLVGERLGAFGWFGIVRLGLVQTALGAIVVLTTSTLKLILFRVFIGPLLFPAAQGSRYCKTSEKQVAMIAQKVMDANQTQDQRRPSIPSPNP